MNIQDKIDELQRALSHLYTSKAYQDELNGYKDSIHFQCLERYNQGRTSTALVLSKYIAEALRRECSMRSPINDKVYEAYVTSFGTLRITVLDVDNPTVIVG